MARLRLFANLREIAGTSAVDIDGETVDEILEAATSKFGDDFGRALAPAQVWVDGDRAARETSVSPASEVAVIPPVSGGATVVQSPAAIEIGFLVGFSAALLIANAISLQWLSVAVVGVGGVWAFDLVASADRRGLPVGHAPVLLAVVGGAISTYRFGAPGMAAATAGAVLLALLWSIIQPGLRAVDSFAAGTLLAIVAAFGASGLVLLRLRSEDEALVFLIVAVVGIAVSWVMDRSDNPVVDPLIGLIVVSLVAGAAASLVWAPETLDAIAASVAASLALVAGRNLGLLVRAGGFFAQGPVPGSLAYFDGLLLAAGAFWAIVTVLS
jgi:molybdopterin synthase sulfur carrier subunit